MKPRRYRAPRSTPVWSTRKTLRTHESESFTLAGGNFLDIVVILICSLQCSGCPAYLQFPVFFIYSHLGNQLFDLFLPCLHLRRRCRFTHCARRSMRATEPGSTSLRQGVTSPLRGVPRHGISGKVWKGRVWDVSVSVRFVLR